MKNDYRDHVKDILDSINKIEQFVKDMTFEDFCEDDKTLFAVIRAFEIIGEASKTIPESIKETSPKIPWREMAGMRDKLIHEYFGVDLKVVWDTIQKDIPEIKPLVEKLKEDLNK